MSQKVKIYFSEEDLQDMQSSSPKIFESDFSKSELWNTWTAKDEDGNEVEVELHLGYED